MRGELRVRREDDAQPCVPQATAEVDIGVAGAVTPSANPMEHPPREHDRLAAHRQAVSDGVGIREVAGPCARIAIERATWLAVGPYDEPDVAQAPVGVKQLAADVANFRPLCMLEQRLNPLLASSLESRAEEQQV